MNLLLCDLVSIFSVTVAALSVLVMFLIGWNIYQFFDLKNWEKKAKVIMDKKIEAFGSMLSLTFNLVTAETLDKKIDLYMNQIDEFSYKFPDELPDLLREFETTVEQESQRPLKIIRGKRDEYVHVLCGINHPSKDKLLRLIREAEEV